MYTKLDLAGSKRMHCCPAAQKLLKLLKQPARMKAVGQARHACVRMHRQPMLLGPVLCHMLHIVLAAHVVSVMRTAQLCRSHPGLCVDCGEPRV